MKSYFTFGMAHECFIEDTLITPHHVLEIEGEDYDDCRAKLWEYVGPHFAFQYPNEPPDMDFFPAGIIRLSDIETGGYDGAA